MRPSPQPRAAFFAPAQEARPGDANRRSLSPAAPQAPLSVKLWTWTKPFQWDVWVTLMFTLFFGGVLFYYFEFTDMDVSAACCEPRVSL